MNLKPAWVPGRFPPFLDELLRSCPKAGEGVNRYLYKLARQLHAHAAPDEMRRLIREATAHCGRDVSDAEIDRAVRRSEANAWRLGGGRVIFGRSSSTGRANFGVGSKQLTIGISAWPPREPELIASIVQRGFKEADLVAASPLRFEHPHAEAAVDALFGNDGSQLLCCGTSARDFDTRSRAEWRGLFGELPLVVPSPMTARTGLTQDGRVSAHTLANTGPRRFLVVEFDFKTPPVAGVSVRDTCAALLWHLRDFLPLSAVVWSGNKSLHGWFPVAGEAEAELLKFHRYAARLGADPATWTRSQFVRMPDGLRPPEPEKGRTEPIRQSLLFLDPSPL